MIDLTTDDEAMPGKADESPMLGSVAPDWAFQLN